MPILDTWINQRINENRLEDNIKDRDGYTPSGKLSAGSLYLPTRFQVLKTLGVPRLPFDAYTLGVFDKGNQIEDKFLESMKRNGALVEDRAKLVDMGLEYDEEKAQWKSTYRETIGYIDSIVYTDLMQSKRGIIPWEVKSVTSYKYKHVKKQGGADWHHCLQACQNALGMGVDHFGIVYISKEHDDPHVMIYQVREYKQDVDRIIQNYMTAMEAWKADRALPAFEIDERVSWLIPKYSPYAPFWYEAPDSAVIKEMETLKII